MIGLRFSSSSMTFIKKGDILKALCDEFLQHGLFNWSLEICLVDYVMILSFIFFNNNCVLAWSPNRIGRRIFKSQIHLHCHAMNGVLGKDSFMIARVFNRWVSHRSSYGYVCSCFLIVKLHKTDRFYFDTLVRSNFFELNYIKRISPPESNLSIRYLP